MRRLPFVLVGVLVLLGASAPRAGAWDGKREGFVLGFGGGVGLGTGNADTEGVFGTELLLGYSFRGVQVQYLGTTVVGSEAVISPGLGFEYHFRLEAPGWFVGAGVGLSEELSIEYTGGPWGPVLQLGAGYEWTSHIALHALMTRFPNTEDVPESINNTCLSLMIRFEAY